MTQTDKIGWILIAVCLFGFIALGYGAYLIDASNGISVDASLRSAGL